MYETLRVVNGYPIERMKGVKAFYHLIVERHYDKKGGEWSKSYHFRTLKAAVAFAESLPANCNQVAPLQ